MHEIFPLRESAEDRTRFGEPLLHHQFQAQARRTPEAVALIEGERSISYAELCERAATAAGALRSAGIGAGTTVGIHRERSIAWVVDLLATLEAGAAVVPLPPSYPPERLREILSFARLDGVIDAAETPLPCRVDAPILRLEDLPTRRGREGDLAAGDPDQPAFVLASSGSTGSPKLIVRSHRSFFHRLHWTWETHPYGPDERCCQKAHMTTTHGIYELFEPLLRGVPQVILPDETVRNLEAFWDTVRDRDISRLLLVPSVLRASLDMPAFAPPPLRVLVLMGEYVQPTLATRALAALPETTCVYSIYGSTEASSALVCDLRAHDLEGRELPLGRPIAPEIEALVLSETLEPVPAGAVGRLYLAGPALFSGYFRDPALTEAALVRPPGRDAPVYDTRDQVRRTDEGELEFVGRVDQTVKIRGFRIDLLEVERALLDHRGVTQAAAVVKAKDSGEASLLAFVTPGTIEPGAVFATLRERLPPYMVPSAIRPLARLPLTASRKVDRARLLAEFQTPAGPAAPARGMTRTEQAVRRAWEETLGHGAFDVATSFFEAGGMSLTVFTLVHRLRQAFGLPRAGLDEQTVYRFPTIAGLAAWIDGVGDGSGGTEAGTAPILVDLRRGDQPDEPPLFLIATPGGTVGAYEKLASELAVTRDVIGLRDPFLWGAREPTAGFGSWVRQYVDAIRARQAEGPYFVGAYSSAGAFGYEVARQLRAAGEEIGLLLLIDPFAMDNQGRFSFGQRVLDMVWARPHERVLIRLAALLRPLLAAAIRRRARAAVDDSTLHPDELEEIAAAAREDKAHLIWLSSLMELNTGLPLSLGESDFEGLEPSRFLAALQARITGHVPGMEPAMIERMVIQYPLQVRCQNHYRLRPFDGPTLLVEPASRYAGIIAAQLRPHVRKLETRRFELGAPGEGERDLLDRFGPWQPHFRCMRDQRFVAALAEELNDRLR